MGGGEPRRLRDAGDRQRRRPCAPTRPSRASTCATAACAASTLESGEELRADVVVAATHPKITFLDQIDRAELPTDFVDAHRALEDAQRHGEGERRGRPAARVHREARLRPRGARRHDRARRVARRHRGRVPGRGRGPRRAALPFADICIPSVFDPTLAPEGKHVVSMFTQWVPHTWASEQDQPPSSTRTPTA